MNAPGGVINQHGNQYIIKGSGRAYSVEHLQEAVLKQVNGQTIKIKDVATVQIGAADKIGDGSFRIATLEQEARFMGTGPMVDNWDNPVILTTDSADPTRSWRFVLDGRGPGFCF